MILKGCLLIVPFRTGVTEAAPEQVEHIQATVLPAVPGAQSLFVELLWVMGENQVPIVILKQVFAEATDLNYASEWIFPPPISLELGPTFQSLFNLPVSIYSGSQWIPSWFYQPSPTRFPPLSLCFQLKWNVSGAREMVQHLCKESGLGLALSTSNTKARGVEKR